MADHDTPDPKPDTPRGRRGISFAHGEGSTAQERTTLHRDRVRMASLILLACFRLVLVNMLLSGDPIWLWQIVVVVLGLAGVAWWLGGPRPLGDRALTVVELGVAGHVGEMRALHRMW